MRRQRPKYNKSQSEMTFPLTRDPDSPPKFKKHKLFAGVSFASRCQLRLQASENWKLLRQRKASLAAKDEQDREGAGRRTRDWRQLAVLVHENLNCKMGSIGGRLHPHPFANICVLITWKSVRAWSSEQICYQPATTHGALRLFSAIILICLMLDRIKIQPKNMMPMSRRFTLFNAICS